jgi:hypothetical protein
MSRVESGVFPVHANDFEVNVNTNETEQWVTVAELEECNVKIDNTTEEWNSFANGGWGSALITGKKSSIELKGKRCIGDAGNDFIAGKLLETGANAYISARVKTPDGKVLTWAQMACAVANAGQSGGATNVGALEATLTGHGKPVLTDAE